MLFEYEAFGPPVVAHELIGMDWWQWQASGDPRPKKYDIKVVVYKGIDISDVKKMFPVNPALYHDYRYVAYSVAMNYLNTLIEENVIASLTSQLIKTRERIQSVFQTTN
ncbi:MAG: hypothetical protein SVR94_09535 [Pseudomonadota bacterium]|nr:hypothetical protein [Pseudomonadota bacterium]